MKSNSERELSPEKTQLILNSAIQEFLENGFSGARMDKIAIAAGVSKATVYRRFPDKESLFTELMFGLARKKGLFQFEQLKTAQGDPSTFFKTFAGEMLDNVETDPQILTFLRIIVAESGRFPELARSFVRNIEKPALEQITQYLASHPELDLPDPEVAARALVGTLLHFILIRDLLQSGDILPMERERLLDGLTTLVIRKCEEGGERRKE